MTLRILYLTYHSRGNVMTDKTPTLKDLYSEHQKIEQLLSMMLKPTGGIILSVTNASGMSQLSNKNKEFSNCESDE